MLTLPRLIASLPVLPAAMTAGALVEELFQ